MEPTTEELEKITFWSNHRFMLLIGGSIVLSLVLTVISMTLYVTSGAAQLDLSRPGYLEATDKTTVDTTFQGYAAAGDINQQTVDEFQRLFEQQSAKAKAVDAFSGDPLDPAALEINATTE